MRRRSSRRSTRIDFVVCLQRDITVKIFSMLDDPIDLIRASAVSHSWHKFVINHSLMKKLCEKKAPLTSNIKQIVEDDTEALLMDDRSQYPFSFDGLKEVHMIYSYLLQALSKSLIVPKLCFECVIGASSTNIYPNESIVNVLLPVDKTMLGNSYWGSKGQIHPNGAEKIIFKLDGGVCIVSHIEIRPYQQEADGPIYSANSVRFRMGHRRSNTDLSVNLQNLPLLQLDDEDNYVWTYTSPVFSMEQVAFLQSFQLPEPVLCIGGYLQIELLGCVERDVLDGLYYIRLGYVTILGHSLLPAFDTEMRMPNEFLLKYRPDDITYVLDYVSKVENEDEEDAAIKEMLEDKPLWLRQLDDLKHLRFP